MTTQTAPPAAAILSQKMFGLWEAGIIQAAAELGIPDLIHSGADTAEAIAEQAGYHLPSTVRLLRGMVTVGLATAGMAEPNGYRRFQLTETGTLLCSESPGSMRVTAQVLLAADHRRAWGRLADGVRTGQSPFVLEHGQKVFDYYAAHPEDRERFSRMMSNLTGTMEPGIVAAAPGLSRFHRICDLGSSRGTLLMGLLQRAPHAHGILFDLPDLAHAARTFLAEHGWDARIDAVGGDFFQSVPPADLYTMKWILHDWSDEQSVQILRNIRRAAQPGASVWIIESTLPVDDSPSFATLMDVNMLCMTDGQERTATHYQRLLREAGFAPGPVTNVPGPIEVSIIEGSVN